MASTFQGSHFCSIVLSFIYGNSFLLSNWILLDFDWFSCRWLFNHFFKKKNVFFWSNFSRSSVSVTTRFESNFTVSSSFFFYSQFFLSIKFSPSVAVAEFSKKTKKNGIFLFTQAISQRKNKNKTKVQHLVAKTSFILLSLLFFFVSTLMLRTRTRDGHETISGSNGRSKR